MGKQVLNTTRQTLIALEVEMADSYFKRLKGLMFRAGLPPYHGLWIVPCFDIHSCFMRFHFDAIFLDKNLKVLYLKESMKPWRFTKIVKGGHIVLELPAGTIASTKTHVGDQLAWQDSEAKA
jgi:uncharacterized membrane protein (UPF0127 family)